MIERVCIVGCGAIGSLYAAHLARVAEVWDKLNRAAGDVEEFNLERKPLIFSAFGLLAEAARG